jgi:hypothetical protein
MHARTHAPVPFGVNRFVWVSQPPTECERGLRPCRATGIGGASMRGESRKFRVWGRRVLAETAMPAEVWQPIAQGRRGEVQGSCLTPVGGRTHADRPTRTSFWRRRPLGHSVLVAFGRSGMAPSGVRRVSANAAIHGGRQGDARVISPEAMCHVLPESAALAS